MIYLFPLIIFFLAVRFPKYLPLVLVLLLPSYILRTTIAGIPTTALELSIYAATIAILTLLVTKKLSWHFVSMTRWTWGLLTAWIFAWGIATIFSINTTASIGAVKAWLLDPLLVVALASLLVRTSIDRIHFIQGIILSGCSVALFGLIQFAFFHNLLQDGRLSSYFIPVANYAAMFLGPTLVLTVGALMQSLISKRWWIAAAVQALALLLSMSYGGFLSVAVAGVFLLLCMPNKQLQKKIFISGTIAAALFIAILSRTENFREHFAADRSSGLVRTQIWVTSWALIRQHPITGIGPNTFEQAYRKEVPRHYFPPLEWLVAQPHNLYLTLWLETGILGLMTFLGLLIYHTWFLFRTFFRDERHRGITIVSLAALLTILVHGFLDTPYFKNDLAIEFLLIAILPWLGQKTSEQK